MVTLAVWLLKPLSNLSADSATHFPLSAELSVLALALNEMDKIRDDSAAKLQDLAQEAAEAAKRLRDKGVDVDTSGSESTETAGEQKEDSDKNRQKETTGDSADTETASREGSRREEGAGGGIRIPGHCHCLRPLEVPHLHQGHERHRLSQHPT